MEIGASGSSVTAIQQAFKTHSERASRLAEATASGAPERNDTFVKDMAELPSDAHNVGINAKTIKTRDEMVGTLLDILA